MAGMVDSTYPKASRVFNALKDGAFPVLDKTEHYQICDGGIVAYEAFDALVQSSGQAISLGQEMNEFMNTERFWEFVEDHGVQVANDSPREMYVYNWIEKAQGPMIFDVGCVLDEHSSLPALPDWLTAKSYPAMKFFSLIYIGPFPHQPNSGWDQIRWHDRALARGVTYNEEMYRELYHRYDYTDFQHITEIQLSID